jgi:hypothetical protein
MPPGQTKVLSHMQFTTSTTDCNRERLPYPSQSHDSSETPLNLQIARLIRHAISPEMAASIAPLVFGDAK